MPNSSGSSVSEMYSTQDDNIHSFKWGQAGDSSKCTAVVCDALAVSQPLTLASARHPFSFFLLIIVLSAYPRMCSSSQLFLVIVTLRP